MGGDMKNKPKPKARQSSADHREMNAALDPAKVIRPHLSPRVEKGNARPAYRINSLEFVALMTIADRAAQPQVRFVVCAATGARENVLDFQAGHHEVLRTEAVAAPIPGRRADTTFYLDRM